MNKPTLAKYTECTGCGACVASCGKNALRMVYDEDGHLRPIVTEESCVLCGACETSCPMLNCQSVDYHDPYELTTYTCWTKNDELCKKATSGGTFAQLAVDFLKQTNASVYGAFLTDRNTIHHIAVREPSELDKILGTKYIQSDASTVMKDIKTNLKSGNPCLFCGTPCQVAGLYAFLGNTNKDNLLTVELICHGVPSKLATDFSCRHYGADHILSYRNKKSGHHKGISCTYIKKDGQVVENQSKDFFSLIFGYTDRLSCYRCKYARIERVADISLGDQWGLHDKYPERKVLGSNLVICNTGKGRHALLDSVNIYSEQNENKTLNAPTLFMPIAIPHSAITSSLHIVAKLPKWIADDIMGNNWRRQFWMIPYKVFAAIERVLYKRALAKKIVETRKRYNWL